MTDKERLEEVKEIIKHNYPPVNYSLLRDALDWLIEQAERVEELEAEIDTLTMAHDNTHRELKQFKAAYLNLSKSVAKLAKANELLVEKNTELAQSVNRTEYKNIRAEVSG